MPDDDWPGRPPEPYDAATADRLIVAHLRRRGIDRATLTAAAAWSSNLKRSSLASRSLRAASATRRSVNVA